MKSKLLNSGKISCYLSFYKQETRKRTKEYLGLHVFTKPKDELERVHNKETKTIAQKILAKKLIEFQYGRFGFKKKFLP